VAPTLVCSIFRSPSYWSLHVPEFPPLTLATTEHTLFATGATPCATAALLTALTALTALTGRGSIRVLIACRLSTSGEGSATRLLATSRLCVFQHYKPPLLKLLPKEYGLPARTGRAWNLPWSFVWTLWGALLSLSFDDRWSLVGEIVDVRLMLCLLWSFSGGKGDSTYRFVVCLLFSSLWHGGLTCCGITLTAERKEQSISGSQLRSEVIFWEFVTSDRVEGKIIGVCIAVLPGCCMVCLSTCRGARAPGHVGSWGCRGHGGQQRWAYSVIKLVHRRLRCFILWNNVLTIW